jgi:opacity protein-like surface antigen
MRLRFNKLSFIVLAITLIISPLALKAQSSPKWAGVHVGVIGGVAAGNYNLHLNDGMGDNLNLDSSLAGGRVGIQGGMDFDFKGLVVGAVADWSWSNARFKEDETASSSGTTGVGEFRSTIKQMTTVRGRVGRHYGRVLPYVHGGLLVADTELKGADEVFGFGSTASTVSGIHNGFVVGAGFEYFMARHYSFSTEYGYNHLSGINVTNAVFGTTAPGFSATENPHFSALTVGFNYHF